MLNTIKISPHASSKILLSMRRREERPDEDQDSQSTTEHALKVLLVDDDETDRLLVQRSLRQSRLPVRVTEAEDAKSSVELLKDHRFDCILLDFNLPDAWGTAIQPHLFRCRWSRVVAISAPRTAL